jgi:hypothetical protein
MGYDPVLRSKPIISEQFPSPSHLEIYQPPTKARRVRERTNTLKKNSQIGICFIAIKLKKKLHREENA